MNLMISTTTLVLVAALSILVNRQLVSRISVNYVSLFFGALLAVIPVLNGLVAAFDSDVFIGLIVAPLLFFEGQSTRMNAVGRNLRQIVSLTVGMVILCTIAAGFGTAWLAALGLPLAFILAAISTPTDATATESVTMGLRVPRQVETSLKMESLFNDASGIILLNMAVLWYVNGYINYGQTLGDFLYSAGGGIVFGALVSAGLIYYRQTLLRSRLNFLNNTYNNGTPLKVIYLLTPFLIYFGAEELKVSGIIAVVFAGLVHNAEGERSALANPKLAYDSFQLLDLVSDILNSVVFIVLGIVLVRTLMDPGVTYNGTLIWIGVGVILYLANLLVRYLYSRLMLRRDNYLSWVFALGGIHGAVTFALAFTVASTQVKTADFNLILMSESVLIILSMVVPTILFRFMLPPVATDAQFATKVQHVRDQMVQAAIEKVNTMDLSTEFKNAMIFDLDSQKGQTTVRQFVSEWQRMVRHAEYTSAEMNLLLSTYQWAFQTERDYLVYQYYDTHQISEALFNVLYREVAMAELMVLDYGGRS